MNDHPLERLFDLLAGGDADGASALLAPGAAWDDPLFRDARELAAFFRTRGRGAPKPLRTTADPERVAVEALVPMRDGLVWDQATQRAQKAETFELPVAVVGERAGDRYSRSASISARGL